MRFEIFHVKGISNKWILNSQQKQNAAHLHTKHAKRKHETQTTNMKNVCGTSHFSLNRRLITRKNVSGKFFSRITKYNSKDENRSSELELKALPNACRNTGEPRITM